MKEPMPARFALVLVDDAMGSQCPQGTLMRFSTLRKPAPESIVLVADRDGNAYVREYRFVRGAHWRAVARQSGFEALDSEEHGLRVLAVMSGFDLPDEPG